MSRNERSANNSNTQKNSMLEFIHTICFSRQLYEKYRFPIVL